MWGEGFVFGVIAGLTVWGIYGVFKKLEPRFAIVKNGKEVLDIKRLLSLTDTNEFHFFVGLGNQEVWIRNGYEKITLTGQNVLSISCSSMLVWGDVRYGDGVIRVTYSGREGVWEGVLLAEDEGQVGNP